MENDDPSPYQTEGQRAPLIGHFEYLGPYLPVVGNFYPLQFVDIFVVLLIEQQ